MKRNLLFIINPVAGHGKGKTAEKIVTSLLSGSEFSIQFEYTKSGGHAFHIARDAAAKDNSREIIAVGGDGTINEVACGLNGTGVKLGIIPMGSGNGLAHYYGIPVNTEGALKVIMNASLTNHDAVRINDKLSFNVSGVGFDAHVANLFGVNGQRGFTGYAKLVLREYFRYKDKNFTITANDNVIKKQAFLVTFANTNQFGNNAIIAPDADASDGKVNLVIIKKPRLLMVPGMIRKLFRNKIYTSPLVSEIVTSEAVIECDEPVPLHIDGEPGGYHSRFDLHVIRNSVRIFTP